MQEPDQPGVIQRFEGPILNQFEQMIKPDMESVEGLLGWLGSPTSMLTSYSNMRSIVSRNTKQTRES